MPSREESRKAALKLASERAADLAALLDDGVEVDSAGDPGLALVCACFCVRTSRLLSAVVHLCSSSFGVESQSLLRTMLQDLVDIRYIATDPHVLAEKWREHETRRRYYTYTTRSSLQDMPKPDDFDDLQALIDRDWAEAKSMAARKLKKSVKNVSKNEARKYVLKDRWTRLSIRGAAEKANQKYADTLELFEWYPYLSEHAHGSPGLAADYLQQHNERVFIRDHRDPRFKSASMAISALVYAHATFLGLCDMGLKYDPSPLIEDLPLTEWEFDDL